MKIGDKVKIRNDLRCGRNFRLYVTEAMEALSGRLATVSYVGEDHDITIDIDDGDHTWSTDMFDPLPGERLYSVGDKVLIREDLQEGYLCKVYINPDMVRYFGKEAIVKDIVYNDRYRLSVDGRCWKWTNDMLIPAPPKLNPEDFYKDVMEEMIGCP